MTPVLKRIARHFGMRQATAAPPGTGQAQVARAGILDEYVRAAPSPQFAVDLFKGEWWSALPASFGATAGGTPHFEDSRVAWAIETLGGVSGKRVLELGPMEGGHTYMLEQAGAASIIAIEANSRAYLKCLIAKEVVGLRRASFLLGDFEEYLRNAKDRFDVVLASGVLYHLKNPLELVHNIARLTDRVYIWTHYCIPERVAAIPHMKHRFPGNHPAEYMGFRYTAYRYEYGDFLNTTRFAGGSDEYSHWLSRDDLFGALRHFGFNDFAIEADDVAHVNGPCISFVARK